MLVRSFQALLAFGIATCPGILTAQTPSGTTPLQYTALQTPCRAVDTRVTGGPIAAGTSQSFNPAGGACNIPFPSTGPIVYALNVTLSQLTIHKKQEQASDGSRERRRRNQDESSCRSLSLWAYLLETKR